jgi:alkylhydroperoxidase family enzyme
MAYIKITSEREAEGTLARVYKAARQRAGRVFNIHKVQSASPKSLQGCMGLYKIVMHGDSPLTRAQREMLGVVVSKANNCHY